MKNKKRRTFQMVKEDLMVQAYMDCVEDLMFTDTVQKMKGYHQHGTISCFEHCVYVSFCSFLWARSLGLDERSVARGALLHDLFLYDWHDKYSHKRFHAFHHPATALKNATQVFHLNDKEQDIIRCHMWPLTIRLPKYKEGFVVSFADKYCALKETIYVAQKDRKYAIQTYVNVMS